MRTAHSPAVAPTRPTRRRAQIALAVVVALAVFATACGIADDPGDASGGSSTTAAPAELELHPLSTTPVPELPVTVPSAGADDVTVTDVSRIVPLSGSLAEIVFTLGLGEHVVARDVSTTFPEAEDLPLVTRAHDVSAEAVLSMEPTVVLASTDTGPPEAIQHIRDAGVPVVVFDEATRIDEIDARIGAIAAAVGVPDAGVELAERTAAELASVTAAVPDGDRPKVAFLYMRGQAGVYLIGGEGSGADSMIEAAGGIDAGSELGLSQFTPITSEALVAAGPDVILMMAGGLDSVGGTDELLEIPGIAETPAGVDGRVVTIDDGILYSFGPRTPAALERLIDELHLATSGAT